MTLCLCVVYSWENNLERFYREEYALRDLKIGGIKFIPSESMTYSVVSALADDTS